MSGCPTPEQLSARPRAPQVDVHLAGCRRCRRRAERLLHHVELESELRDALKSAPPPPPSPTFPGYAEVAELHRGGQGIVYRAVQAGTRRPVAIKVLADGALASERQRQRFEREIRLAASLRHPNVVAVHDGGEADGRRFLVMELVDGVTATDWRGPADSSGDDALRHRLRTFVKICDAVHFAHQRGVLHRDLKPGNILVEADGEPRILDFGLAATLDGEDPESLTRSGQFLGTLRYAAPEQVAGRTDDVDERTDVHALGVLLYEMLAGRTPYAEHASIGELARAITEVPPPAPGMAADLDTIVLTALAKDPARRYATAAELARDVERYLSGDPILARRDSPWYVLRKTLWRHRRLTAAATAALLATAVLLLGWLQSRRTARESDTRARMQSRLASDLDTFVDTVLNSPTRGRVVLMKEALDAAAARLTAEEPADADTALSLHTWLGRRYHRLGFGREAAAHYRSAHELAAVLRGAGAEETARLQLDRANALLEICDWAAAGAALSQAAVATAGWPALDLHRRLFEGEWHHGRGELSHARRLFGAVLGDLEPGSVLHGYCLRALGLLARDERDLARSEQLLRQALRVWEGLGPTRYARERANTLQLLGQTLINLRHWDEAVVNLTEAEGAFTTLLGGDAPQTVLCTAQLAAAIEKRDGAAAAEPHIERALATADVVRRIDTFMAARALGELAAFLDRRGERQAAARLLRDAWEKSVRVVGARATNTAVLADNLSRVLVDLQRGDEALAVLQQSIPVHESLQAHARLSFALEVAARAHLQRGDVAAAEKASQRALDLRLQGHGDAEDVADSRLQKAWILLFGRGDRAAARPEAEQALAAYRGAECQDDLRVASAAHLLGWIEFADGHRDEARPLLEQAFALRQRHLGRSHPHLCWTENALAACELVDGDAARAEQLAADALARARDAESERVALIDNSLANLASALVRQGRRPDACARLRERWQMLCDAYGADSAAARRALDDLHGMENPGQGK